MIPMVVIHVNGESFSLGMYENSSRNLESIITVLRLFIVGAMTVCFLYSITFMKLWSYIQVNMWCRIELQKETGSQKCRSRSQSISIAELRMAHKFIIIS